MNFIASVEGTATLQAYQPLIAVIDPLHLTDTQLALEIISTSLLKLSHVVAVFSDCHKWNDSAEVVSGALVNYCGHYDSLNDRSFDVIHGFLREQ
jgi:hypothetical protein